MISTLRIGLSRPFAPPGSRYVQAGARRQIKTGSRRQAHGQRQRRAPGHEVTKGYNNLTWVCDAGHRRFQPLQVWSPLWVAPINRAAAVALPAACAALLGPRGVVSTRGAGVVSTRGAGPAARSGLANGPKESSEPRSDPRTRSQAAWARFSKRDILQKLKSLDLRPDQIDDSLEILAENHLISGTNTIGTKFYEVKIEHAGATNLKCRRSYGGWSVVDRGDLMVLFFDFGSSYRVSITAPHRGHRPPQSPAGGIGERPEQRTTYQSRLGFGLPMPTTPGMTGGAARRGWGGANAAGGAACSSTLAPMSALSMSWPLQELGGPKLFRILGLRNFR